MKKRELLERIEALEAHCAALEIRIMRLEADRRKQEPDKTEIWTTKFVPPVYRGPYLDLRPPQLKEVIASLETRP